MNNVKKKKKKGDNKKDCFLAILLAKALGIKTLLLTGLFIFAKKALIVSKIALLLAGAIAIQKYIESKKHGSEISHIVPDDNDLHDEKYSDYSPNDTPYGIQRRSSIKRRYYNGAFK